MIVNYIREHEAFIEYASDNGLSANERLVWYALIHIFNSRAQGKVWADGFIRIANKRLLSFLPMQFDAMAKARNALKQRGLIEYEQGQRNKDMPMYRMKFFSAEPSDDPNNPDHVENPVENSVDNSAGRLVYPLKTDNMQGNTGGNIRGNIEGNIRGNIGDMIHRRIREGDVYSTVTDSDRSTTATATISRAREDAQQITLTKRQENYIRWFEEFCHDRQKALELRQIVASGVYTYPQLTAVLTLVQGKTERNKLSEPLEYLKAVLIDWNKHEIRTREDIESYMSVDLDPGYANNGYHCIADFDRYASAE